MKKKTKKAKAVPVTLTITLQARSQGDLNALPDLMGEAPDIEDMQVGDRFEAKGPKGSVVVTLTETSKAPAVRL